MHATLVRAKRGSSSRRFITVPALAIALASTSLDARAFDPEDYATTYRATRDARFKAERDYYAGLHRFRLWAGIMSLYGYVGDGGGVYNDPSSGYLDHLGANRVDTPPWCRAHATTSDRRGPTTPAVRYRPSRFVVGQEDASTVRYESQQYLAAGEEAYLHFRTEGGAGDDPVSILAQFIATYPYAAQADEDASSLALQEAIAWRTAGHPSWALQEAGWMVPYSLAGRYAEWFEPGGDMHTTINYVNSNPQPTTPYGYCDFNENVEVQCPAGTTCVDFGWGIYSWDPNGEKYRWRCVAETPRLFNWPPNSVDKLNEGYWPMLIASSDPEDSPGLHWQNGVPDMEDLATTYRASRDAYVKGRNELMLATPPHESARAANAVMVEVFLSEFDAYLD
jgi:hypothetical protein